MLATKQRKVNAAFDLAATNCMKGLEKQRKNVLWKKILLPSKEFYLLRLSAVREH